MTAIRIVPASPEELPGNERFMETAGIEPALCSRRRVSPLTATTLILQVPPPRLMQAAGGRARRLPR